MSGPLSGINIVDLTSVVMGPFATQLLGDMGADVIKVEPPGGEIMRFASRGRHTGMSTLYLNINRNKRSFVLNLKHEAGREALLKLIEQSDVLVSNIRPLAMARLGLGYEDVVKVNPQVIYVSGVGYGQDGPYADRPAYDDLIQTMSGLTNLFQQAYDDEPKFVPSNICDRITGLTMVNAVTAALFHRERTGLGQSIEVPMFETMVQFLMGEHLGGHTCEPPIGEIGYQRVLNPNRIPYPTKDGHLAILVYNNKHWATFLSLIGKPELIGQGIFTDAASRSQSIVEVYGFVKEQIARHTTAEWLDILANADIPHAPVREFSTLFADEHLRAINF